MSYIPKIVMAGALALVVSGSATAGAYEDNMARCLKSANAKDAASVVLECTADGGKLSGCKVLTNDQPGKGFDKAAICMAETLPMGSKTGVVKLPVRFPGGG